jgi:hypothetical protein
MEARKREYPRENESGCRPACAFAHLLVASSETASHAGRPAHVAFPPIRALRVFRRVNAEVRGGLKAGAFGPAVSHLHAGRRSCGGFA